MKNHKVKRIMKIIENNEDYEVDDFEEIMKIIKRI